MNNLTRERNKNKFVRFTKEFPKKSRLNLLDSFSHRNLHDGFSFFNSFPIHSTKHYSHCLISEVAFLLLFTIIDHLHSMDFRLYAVTVDGGGDKKDNVDGDLDTNGQ